MQNTTTLTLPYSEQFLSSHLVAYSLQGIFNCRLSGEKLRRTVITVKRVCKSHTHNYNLMVKR